MWQLRGLVSPLHCNVLNMAVADEGEATRGTGETAPCNRSQGRVGGQEEEKALIPTKLVV